MTSAVISDSLARLLKQIEKEAHAPFFTHKKEDIKRVLLDFSQISSPIVDSERLFQLQERISLFATEYKDSGKEDDNFIQSRMKKVTEQLEKGIKQKFGIVPNPDDKRKEEEISTTEKSLELSIISSIKSLDYLNRAVVACNKFVASDSAAFLAENPIKAKMANFVDELTLWTMPFGFGLLASSSVFLIKTSLAATLGWGGILVVIAAAIVKFAIGFFVGLVLHAYCVPPLLSFFSDSFFYFYTQKEAMSDMRRAINSIGLGDTTQTKIAPALDNLPDSLFGKPKPL